jgi:copper chaperone CopZ
MVAWLSIAAGLGACISSAVVASLVLLKNAGLVSALDAEDWRSLFLAWSVVTLIASLLFAFQVKRIPLQNSLPADAVKRMLIIQRLVACAAILFLAVSFKFESLSSSVAGLFERQWPTTLSSNVVTKTIKLPMDCAGCAKSVERTLRKETLAEKAEADFQKSEVVIWLDPQKTSLSVLIEKLKAHGFIPEEK